MVFSSSFIIPRSSFKHDLAEGCRDVKVRSLGVRWSPCEVAARFACADAAEEITAPALAGLWRAAHGFPGNAHGNQDRVAVDSGSRSHPRMKIPIGLPLDGFPANR